MSTYQLAQLNFARLSAPIDSPQLADFVSNLERINALAVATPGFVWRLQTEGGDATAINHFGDDMLVNMSEAEERLNELREHGSTADAFTFREPFDAAGEAVSVDVTTDIVIERPPDVVAAYAGDPGNAPSWYVNIQSVEWQTEPPVTVGSRVAFVAHFLGRRMAYTYEVVEHVPGERLVMRTAEGPFPMETSYTWEAMGEGHTRMTLRNRGEPSGFSKWVAPFMVYAMRRANQKDLALLKAMLEGDIADRGLS